MRLTVYLFELFPAGLFKPPCIISREVAILSTLDYDTAMFPKQIVLVNLGPAGTFAIFSSGQVESLQ